MSRLDKAWNTIRRWFIKQPRHLDTDELIERLAEVVIGYYDNIAAVVKYIPDEDFGPLINRCRAEAKPDESKNFAIPEWDRIAERIEGELGIRVVFRKAEEHFETTGSGYYCLHCGGDCTPEHIQEQS